VHCSQREPLAKLACKDKGFANASVTTLEQSRLKWKESLKRLAVKQQIEIGEFAKLKFVSFYADRNTKKACHVT
jgi:hypothetical protein